MTEDSGPKTAARGDAAYRAQKDAINARNDAARKAGREHRQAEDRKAAQRKAQSDHDEMKDLRHTFGGNTAH